MSTIHLPSGPSRQTGLATRAMLLRAAPLARSLSEHLCSTMNGRDTCDALHGIWGELRLLGLAAEPARHGAFYSDALGALAVSAGSPRLLVSGAADWGMLETAAAAYRQHDARLDVTVVDRCATPVLLCAWYGAEVGLPVRTTVADAALYQDDAPFDVICTHSLLTYAPLEGRTRLVGNWRRLLRPGGRVVTVTRLSSEIASPAEVEARARHFGDLAVEHRVALGNGSDLDELRARAHRFAMAQISFPVGGTSDVSDLFESQGFEVERLDVRQLDGTLGAREPVGGGARGGSYAEIVAVRR